MTTITVILLMLLAVVVSAMIVRASPLPLPLPLVQIALGAAIAMASSYRVELNPDVFFLLFLPPLLFLDGWRIPKDDLLRDKGTIIEMAFGLVICTVLGVGLLLNWLIPAMPLAVAFALAAVLSPTDPVAVAAVARRVPIPKRIMHILEGESLLNDASGLVCLRFAVAAAMTGVFSLPQAALTFVWLAVGGLGIGYVVTRTITLAKGRFAARYGEDGGSQILISLLIPFAAYLAAEHAHASGILAAVAAGITMSYAETTGSALATTRIRRNAVWDTVQLALNGIIFVLLGEQLPHIVDGAAEAVSESGHHSPWWLLVYVLVLNAALALMRFAWVWLSVRFTMFSRRSDGSAFRPGLRLIGAMSVAGARGSITLAGVLTLPVVMADGSDFPARDLAIFLAAGVIILSLVVANTLLPWLLRGLVLPPEPSAARHADEARVATARAAIRAIEARQHELSEGQADAALYAQAASRVMGLYRERIDGRDDGATSADEARRYEEEETALRLAGLAAERDELFRLLRRRKLEDEVARRLIREIDLQEARYRG